MKRISQGISSTLMKTKILRTLLWGLLLGVGMLSANEVVAQNPTISVTAPTDMPTDGYQKGEKVPLTISVKDNTPPVDNYQSLATLGAPAEFALRIADESTNPEIAPRLIRLRYIIIPPATTSVLQSYLYTENNQEGNPVEHWGTLTDGIYNYTVAGDKAHTINVNVENATLPLVTTTNAKFSGTSVTIKRKAFVEVLDKFDTVTDSPLITIRPVKPIYERGYWTNETIDFTLSINDTITINASKAFNVMVNSQEKGSYRFENKHLFKLKIDNDWEMVADNKVTLTMVSENQNISLGIPIASNVVSYVVSAQTYTLNFLSKEGRNQVYMGKEASGNGDGTSFANKTVFHVRDAINLPTNTDLYLATGEYSTVDAAGVFWNGFGVAQGVAVYGGYIGTEIEALAAPSQRQMNTQTDKTSGLAGVGCTKETIFNSQDNGWDIVNGLVLFGNNYIDGITIKNATGVAIDAFGASELNNMKVYNCTKMIETNDIMVVNNSVFYANGHTPNALIQSQIDAPPGSSITFNNCIVATSHSVGGPFMSGSIAFNHCILTQNSQDVDQPFINANAVVSFRNSVLFNHHAGLFFTAENAPVTGTKLYTDQLQNAPAHSILFTTEDARAAFTYPDLDAWNANTDLATLSTNAKFDYRLTRASMLTNAGTPSPIPYDINGQPRSGSAPDVGCYETQVPDIANTDKLYMGTIGNGQEITADIRDCDGSSWAKALPNFLLDDVLKRKSVKELYITGGTYVLNSNHKLEHPLKIYGGLNGGENSIQDRKAPVLNVSGLGYFSPNTILKQSSTQEQKMFEITGNNIFFDGISFSLANNLLTKVDSGFFKLDNKGPNVFKNCYFDHATTTGDGGAIHATSQTDSLMFDNCAFDTLQAKNGGAVYTESFKDLIFNKCRFNSNSATVNGGAIYAKNAENIIIKNSKTENIQEIVNNKATVNGGFLFAGEKVAKISLDTLLAYGKLVGENIPVHANQGGLVFVDSTGTNLSLNNASVTLLNVNVNGTESGKGGVIASKSTQPLLLNNCTFSENKALGDDGIGGVISHAGNIVATNMGAINKNSAFIGSVFSATTSISIDGATQMNENNGPLLHLPNGPLNVKNVVEIKDNKTNNGGALFINTNTTDAINLENIGLYSGNGCVVSAQGSSVTIKNAKFENNLIGATSLISADTIVVNQMICSNNQTEIGLLTARKSIAINEKSLFEHNTIGSGVLVAPTVTAMNSRFVGNTSSGDVGVISATGTTPVVTLNYCRFLSNKATKNAIANVEGTFNASRCVFTNNSSKTGSNINSTGKATIDNSLFAFNTGSDGAVLSSEVAMDMTNCTLTKNKDLSTTSGTNTLKIPTSSMQQVVNTIIWGNKGGNNTSLQLPKEVTKNSAIEGLATNRANLTDDPNTIIINSNISNDARGPEFLITDLINNQPGANDSYPIEKLDNLMFTLTGSSPCINRGTVTSKNVDLLGNARTQVGMVDIGAHETPYTGIAFIKMQPDTGYYGDPNGHHSKIVLSEPENFPSFYFKEVTQFKAPGQSEFKEAFYGPDEIPGLKKYITPEAQTNWRYFPGVLDYTVLPADLTLNIECRIGAMKFTPDDDVTVNESITFDIKTNRDAAEVKCQYAGVTYDVGKGLTIPSFTKQLDAESNTFVFLASGKNYEPITQTINIAAKPVETGYVVMFNGVSQGFKKEGENILLTLEGAPSGRAIWSSPNDGITIKENDRISNPLRFSMPKKRVVVEAHGRDFYVGLTAMGSGDGRSHANRAVGSELPAILNSASKLSIFDYNGTRSENFVFVDSGTYQGTLNSPIAFNIPTYTKLIGTNGVNFTNNTNTYLFELATKAGIENIIINGKGTTPTLDAIGVYCKTENATANIDSVLITGCTTAVSATGKSDIKIDNSNFQNNQLALHVKDAVLNATNCLIAHNKNEALKVESASNYSKTKGILLHCTIANNSTTPLMSQNQYSQIEVNNSILWHATIDITLPVRNTILTGCAIKMSSVPADNIKIQTDMDVNFVSPPSAVDSPKWSTYDWNLNPTSVLINRAKPNKTGLLAFDIQKNPRTAYGLPDIGAYEVDTKGVSYATFEKDHVTYNAKEVQFALKDNANYPGKDDLVTFTPPITDSGIYPNVTPTGSYWTYKPTTVIVDSAPLTSFTILNNSSEATDSTLSSLGINCTATGIDNVPVQGLFVISTMDGKAILDSTLIQPAVDSVFGYVFTPLKNYAPNVGTFKVDCQAAPDGYKLVCKTHPIEYGASLNSSIDTAYGVIEEDGLVVDTIYGEYSFFENSIPPVGTMGHHFQFKPFTGKNKKQKDVMINVTVTQQKFTIQQNIDSFIVTDTLYVYGQLVEPKVYLLHTGEMKDSKLLDKTNYTILYDEPIEEITNVTAVGTHRMTIENTEKCNYKFKRESLDTCIITQKPLNVNIEKTIVPFGTKPMPVSTMTGLAYTDTIPYDFSTKWKNDSAVGFYANEFIFIPTSTTDSYLVSITGDSTLTITQRAYSPEEILVKEPTDLIYNGTAKGVSITSNNSDLILTSNDYTITYDADTTMAGTINYSVLFKNNFSGRVNGTYTITLTEANIVLSNLRQKYDGKPKQAEVTVTGSINNTKISYLKGTEIVGNYTGVTDPGLYTIRVVGVQAGSTTPIVRESPFEIYTTQNSIAFEVVTHQIKEGDTVMLVAHLVDTPSANVTIPFIINSTLPSELYHLSAQAFKFEKNMRTDSIILTAYSDSCSNPTANIKLVLYSPTFMIESGKDVCSININDDGDHSLDLNVVVSKLKFIEEENVIITSSVPVATLKLLSGKAANVTLKFSSMATGDLTCNDLPYDGGKGVTLTIIEGVNPIKVTFSSEKLKTLKKPITVSVSKITVNDLKLTNESKDKTRKITYFNDAPLAITDDVSVMLENTLATAVDFDLLKNDEKYFDDVTPPGELIITSLSTYTINNIKLSVKDQKIVNADFSGCKKEELIKGLTVQFTYTINQIGAGAANGIVNMTLAFKQVKGAEVEIKGENITKKTAVIAKYEDPFKKPSKDGTRTRSIKMKRTSDTAAMINSNIAGFNKSSLSKAYSNGNFFADMFDQEDSKYYFTSRDTIKKTLVQVACIGSKMTDKPAKGKVEQDLGSWNISPAENIKLGSLDSVVLAYTSKGVILDTVAFADTMRASNGKTYALISGDYFGSTPTAYFEYLADNGKIKKISLSVCKSVSVKSATSGKTLKWSTKTANFGNVGKGSKVILLWPTKASLDKLKHAYTSNGRIDLIINNTTFQTPVKNFQNNGQNIVK